MSPTMIRISKINNNIYQSVFFHPQFGESIKYIFKKKENVRYLTMFRVYYWLLTLHISYWMYKFRNADTKIIIIIKISTALLYLWVISRGRSRLFDNSCQRSRLYTHPQTTSYKIYSELKFVVNLPLGSR